MSADVSYYILDTNDHHISGAHMSEVYVTSNLNDLKSKIARMLVDCHRMESYTVGHGAYLYVIQNGVLRQKYEVNSWFSVTFKGILRLLWLFERPPNCPFRCWLTDNGGYANLLDDIREYDELNNGDNYEVSKDYSLTTTSILFKSENRRDVVDKTIDIEININYPSDLIDLSNDISLENGREVCIHEQWEDDLQPSANLNISALMEQDLLRHIDTHILILGWNYDVF